VRRRLTQGIHDAVEVILRIGLKIRVPNGFVAENDFAVHNCRDLAIAAAEVKPIRHPSRCRPSGVVVARSGGNSRVTTTSIGGHRSGRRWFLNQICRWLFTIMFLEHIAQRLWSVEINPKAAPRPQEKFHHPFEMHCVRCRLRMSFGKNGGRKMEHRAVGLFQRQIHCHSFPAGANLLPKGAIGQNCRSKERVQHRCNPGAIVVRPLLCALQEVTFKRGTRRVQVFKSPGTSE